MSYDDSYKKDNAVENKELSEIKIKPLGLDCSKFYLMVLNFSIKNGASHKEPIER